MVALGGGCVCFALPLVAGVEAVGVSKVAGVAAEGKQEGMGGREGRKGGREGGRKGGREGGREREGISEVLASSQASKQAPLTRSTWSVGGCGKPLGNLAQLVVVVSL